MKKTIEDRIKVLEVSRQQSIDKSIAILGAILELKELLINLPVEPKIEVSKNNGKATV